MALVINNRVRETTATTGTGAQTLAGAVDGFQTFAAGIGNSNTTYYAISLNTENEWEVGLGTLNGDSSTLTRTTVLESSNSDSAVDFSAGSKEIFCTLPSEKAVYLDASDNQVGGFSSVADDTTPQLGGDLDVNGNAIVSASNGDIAIDANGTGMVTMTANSVTGDVIPGKLAGTNFSNSLLIGHATTGTLDAAEQNTGVGINAMDAITTADSTTAIGYNALSKVTTGTYNTGVGSGVLYDLVSSHQNTSVGFNSGTDVTGGYNTLMGYKTGDAIVAGAYNTCVGRQAGDNITTGDGNVCIGTNADPASATDDNQLVIGTYDGTTTTKWLTGDSSGILSFGGNAASQAILKFYEDSDNGSNYIAVQSPAANAGGADTTLTLPELTGDLIPGKFGGTDFTDSIIIGHSTTGTLDDARQNYAIGTEALESITSGDGNVVMGKRAGEEVTSGSYNILIGDGAGDDITTALGNTVIGAYAFGGSNTTTTGNYNTVVGYNALAVASGGENNVAIGKYAGGIISTGDFNINVGQGAGNNITSGSGNVVIGNADVSSATGDDQLSISDGEDGAVVWMTGESTGNVEINEVWNPSLSTTGKAFVMGF